MTVEWKKSAPLGFLNVKATLDKHATIIDSLISRVRFLNQDIASETLSNVSAIESDPTFITTKKTLLQLAPVTSIVPYTIASFINILEELNKKDNYAYVKKRPETSLNQIYMLTLLLSDFTETNWRLKERSELSSISSRSTEDSDKEFPHRIPADPLESNLVMKSLQILVKFKSFKKARSIIRQLDGGSAYFELASSNQTIAEIDYNIDAIVRYLSSASPQGYSKTTEIAVANNADISNSDILGYLEYLAFLNLSPSTFEREFQLLVNFTEMFKNSYIQHIHSSFFIDSVINYSVCYTREFLDTINKPEVNKIGDVYFEKIYLKYKFSMDSEKKFYYNALAAASIIMPKQLENFPTCQEAADFHNKKLLKTSGSKKQKLWQQIARNIFEGGDKIPTLCFFMVIFNAASVVVQYDPKHPIVRIAREYVLQVYNILNPANNRTLMLDTDISAIDKMRIEFYSLAIVLTPELIKPKVINIIANPDTSLQFYYIIIHALRNLIRKPYHKEFAYKLIDTIAITLRDHCGKLAKIVHETVADYDNLLSDASSSSHSFKYNSSAHTSDSKTLLSSKYSSTTLSAAHLPGTLANESTAVTNSYNSGSPEPSPLNPPGGITHFGSLVSPLHTPSTTATPTSNTSSDKDGYFSSPTSTTFERHLGKSMKEKTRAKKESAVSFFASLSRDKRSSAAKVASASTRSLSNQASNPNVGATALSSSNINISNSDRISMHSISASHVSNHSKPIGILNVEYMKRVENNAFLSREILKLVFQIFRSYPSFFFKLPSIYNASPLGEKSKNAFIEAARQVKTILFELKRILDPLLISLADNDIKLVEVARRLVIKILDNEDGTLAENYIAFFSSCYLQSGFIEISLTYPLYDIKFQEIMSFSTLFWSKRSEIMQKIEMDELVENIGTEGLELVQKCCLDTEKLILIMSCTPGSEFYRILKLNCALFTKDLETDSFLAALLRKSVNAGYYKSIAEEDYFVSGPMALQKRIRKKLYANIHVYSDGLLQAVDIIFERWKEFYSRRDPSSLEETEHRNYAGFLAVVLGGAMTINSSGASSSARVKNFEYFVAKKYSHLKSDEVQYRETAAELLANELHPFSHHYIIRNIQRDVQAIVNRKETIEAQYKKLTGFEKDYTPTEIFSLTSEEVLSLQLYLRIMTGFLNYGDTDMNFAHSVDLRDIGLKLTSLLKRPFGVDEEPLLQLKVKACKFLQKFAENPDSLVLRGCSNKWKNLLIHAITSWLDLICFGDTVSEDYNLFALNDALQSSSRKEMDSFIHYELALECLKAISYLFKKTSIYPIGAQYQSEVRFIQTVTFVNYFNLYSRILESSLSKTPRFSSKSAIDRQIDLIKDQAIVAISNMLEYNYDIGIQHALPLSFHTGLKVKHAFLVVFKNIIDTIQQSKIRESEEFEKEAFNNLTKVICGNTDTLIAMTRSMVLSDYDTFSYNVLQGLLAYNTEIPKITDLVEYELDVSQKCIDTLRKNSIPAKVLSLYAKQIGATYLISVLQPVFEEMNTKEDSFEVEKLKTDNELVIEENVEKFFYCLRQIVNNICSSVERVPTELKILCANIRQLVKRKSGKDSTALLVLSSFLFLRFICPAIVSPKTENVITFFPSAVEKRNYMQLAKVFQILANDSISSIKFSSLAGKKDELNSLKAKLFAFINTISNDTSIPVPKKATYTVNSDVFATLYSFLIHRNDEICLHLVHPVTSRKVDLKKSIADVHTLQDVSVNIGEKYLMFTPSVPNFVTKDSYPELYDVFKKYKDYYDPFLIDCPFIVQSYARDGTLIIIFSHQYFAKVMHYPVDLLVYRAVQRIQRKWEEPFKVLLDCSFFEEKNVELFVKFFTALNVIAKSVWLDCLNMSYYNVNPAYAKVLAKTAEGKFFGNMGLNPKFMHAFYSPFDSVSILEGIPVPKWSLDAVKDTQLTLDCLIYSEERKKYVPVVIKIGKIYIYWSSYVHRFDIEGMKKQMRVTECSRVDDWVDAFDCNFINNDGNEFQVTVKGHGILRLSSSKKPEILKSLFLARLSHQSDNFAEYQPTFFDNSKLSESFLGSILASVLLNMVSKSEEVRNTAFDSLVLLVSFYKLKIGRNIISEGSTFPKDFIPYVLDIGDALSTNHPELTSDFISALTEAYENAESKYACLMLLSLWIKNIHNEYYEKAGVLGTQKVEEIIHKFISRIPPAGNDLLLTFKTFIWKSIVSDVNLVEFAVSDIVREALSKEIKGENWENINSVISYFPTIDVCGLLIKQLRQIVDIPNFKSDRQVSVNISWIKIKILVKICESLAFDALFVAETYLAEICFVVSMLVNIGPYDLRVSVRNLIINVLHSFLGKPELSEKSRQHILKIIEDFSGPGSKITFGLIKTKQESYAVLSNRPDQLFGAFTHLENFCTALIEFIELQPVDLRSVWKGRWSSYVLSAAFRQNGPLQGRGILVAGILCKSGISDSVIIEFMRKYTEWCTGDLYTADAMTAVCFNFAFANFAEALTKISQYTGFLFAVGFTHCAVDNAIFFQTACKVLKNSILGMLRNGFLNDDIDILSLIEGFRQEYHEYFEYMENFFELSLGTGAVDQVLIHFAIKALQLPYMKKQSFGFLDLIFKIRVGHDLRNHKKALPEGTEFDESKFRSDGISYLLLLFLSSVHGEDHKQLLHECGLDFSRLLIVNDTEIPEILLGFFKSGSDSAVLALYQASLYFCHENTDIISKLRFILLVNALSDSTPDLVFYVYLLVKDALVREIETTGSIDILQAAYQFIEHASLHPEFEHPEKLQERYDALLEKYRIGGIKRTGFFSEGAYDRKENIRLATSPASEVLVKFFFDKANAYTRVD